MEDSVSIKSNDSATIIDDYEFVNDTAKAVEQRASDSLRNQQPLLGIANNGNLDDLRKSLGEVLQEDNSGNSCETKPLSTMTEIQDVPKEMEEVEKQDLEVTAPVTEEVNHITPTPLLINKETVRKVGKSQFYSSELVDPLSDEADAVPDVQQDCTIFSGVVSLGTANINAPRSETEIQRNMAILNREQGNEVIKVSISVPSKPDGHVQLHDAAGRFIAQYEVTSIMYFSQGGTGTPEEACFAFTCPLGHKESQESTIFQCHVFRCDIPEAVGQVNKGFAKAFNRVPRSMTNSVIADLVPTPDRSNVYVFEVSLEIKEDDGRGSYSAVPKDRTCFKLHKDSAKQLCLNVQQISDNEIDLCIEKCFGLLVSPGKKVKHSDMQLLEMVSMGTCAGDRQCCLISGNLDPTEPAFELLNEETPKDQTCTFMTVGVDLVIRHIREPVRFLIETPIKVFPQSHRIWTFRRSPLIQQFTLTLKEVCQGEANEKGYEVVGIKASERIERSRINLTLNLASLIGSPDVDIESLTPKEDYLSDGDEPLLSGTGNVSNDCTEEEMLPWKDVIAKWSNTKQRPRQLADLVKQSIPEALRGEVWFRLAGCEDDSEMMNKYRILITKECSCENVILRDINRTFPAHDYFKEAGGLGQDLLYRISKAYAVYDTEVGYCQGISFVAASLLLHMPEEQAFCVLEKLMYNYGLRDMYKDGFENLYLRLYQLNKLMEEHLPQLWQHFSLMNVESHMFASQWFLTLFTARFPLYFVFHILDVFLLQGTETLFQVAIALLKVCKDDLLKLDFESILKYFRVAMPKRCRTPEASRQIMQLACRIKVKKLKKYEQDFLALKEEQDHADQCLAEHEQLKLTVTRLEEEKKEFQQEAYKVKEMLKREITKADNERTRNEAIISEYKQICHRMDIEKAALKTAFDKLQNRIEGCEKCTEFAASVNAEVDVEKNDRVKEEDHEPELQRALKQIHELEQQLAETKLAHVEVSCTNQELQRQLKVVVAELQTAAKNTYPPWLAKALTSIKEVANNKIGANSGPGGVTRRDSAPMSRTRPTSKQLRPSSSVEWFIHEPADHDLTSNFAPSSSAASQDNPPTPTKPAVNTFSQPENNAESVQQEQ